MRLYLALHEGADALDGRSRAAAAKGYADDIY
jgi:hypothetical protein